MENKKAIVFVVENEEFAIPVEFVISIEKYKELTTIPHMPVYMHGVTTIREELVPIIDMGTVLYDRPIEETEKTRLIVTKLEEISIGFIVDDAKEILDIPSENIKKLNLVAYQQNNYFIGVANLNERLISLVDPVQLCDKLEGMQLIKEHVQSHQ
ncbi:chemotaxis protein CheW [Bacillus timonensis]|nr:chemotaxis protein CheW [Bacillus timonensis]